MVHRGQQPVEPAEHLHEPLHRRIFEVVAEFVRMGKTANPVTIKTFLPADLVLRLFSGLTATGADVAVARTGGRAQPVFCLCRRDLLPHLAAYLASGERRMAGWHATLKVAEIAFDDEAEAFANVNSRDELGRFESGDPRV